MNYYGTLKLFRYIQVQSGMKIVYTRIESGSVYTEDMNDELVEKLNTGNFTEGSAILRSKHYNTKKIDRSTSTCYRKG